MVSAIWENVSLDELIMVTEMTDDCVKLKFVPLMESVETRFRFRGGRILRTTVKPLLLGLVPSREVESVMKEPETMPDGSVVSVGVGLQSPLLLDKVQQSDVLKALASEPPSKGKVRSVDHTSAWLALESLESLELQILKSIFGETPHPRSREYLEANRPNLYYTLRYIALRIW